MNWIELNEWNAWKNDGEEGKKEREKERRKEGKSNRIELFTNESLDQSRNPALFPPWNSQDAQGMLQELEAGCRYGCNLAEGKMGTNFDDINFGDLFLTRSYQFFFGFISSIWRRLPSWLVDLVDFNIFSWFVQPTSEGLGIWCVASACVAFPRVMRLRGAPPPPWSISMYFNSVCSENHTTPEN